MLRIIGGAGRSGKSLLSRRLLIQVQQPYLSLDVLKMGIVNSLPDFGLDPEAPSIEVAEKLWPLARAMAVNMIETDVYYIIEGEILPKHADELSQQYPGRIRACFLGYAEIAPERKLKQIREFGGHPNDWVSGYDDAYVLDLVESSIEFSRYLRAECLRLGIPYFDVSRDFVETLGLAAVYLRG